VRIAEPGRTLRYSQHSVERAPSTTPAGSTEEQLGRVSPELHEAIELIGKRWAGAIIWALGERDHYFGELSQAVPGMSDRLLSRRLRELESEGVVRRAVHDGNPPRVSYGLTDKGRALGPAIAELAAWARHWNGA
jgi:DNA-binding HxlR family transcriptional regulator